jgi:hypothetical protein
MKKGEGDSAMCRESVKEDFRGFNRKRIKLVHFRIFLYSLTKFKHALPILIYRNRKYVHET